VSAVEQRLRDSLGAFAEQVQDVPGDYGRAHREWRRRERRRRWFALALASVLIVVADLVGLWALDRAGTTGGDLLFEHPALVPVPVETPAEVPVEVPAEVPPPAP